MKNTIFALIFICAACQPDYGHLQVQYEQLLEVQKQVQTATNEARSNQKKLRRLKQR